MFFFVFAAALCAVSRVRPTGDEGRAPASPPQKFARRRYGRRDGVRPSAASGDGIAVPLARVAVPSPRVGRPGTHAHARDR